MAERLPNAARALIDPRKLQDDTLNPEHVTGRHKAAFFAQMGYSAERWERLERDIREQHLSQPAVPGQESSFGQKYVISAPIQGPEGEPRQVQTVWIIRIGHEIPELVTILPDARRREAGDGSDKATGNGAGRREHP